MLPFDIYFVVLYVRIDKYFTYIDNTAINAFFKWQNSQFYRLLFGQNQNLSKMFTFFSQHCNSLDVLFRRDLLDCTECP